jgi:putative addiction module component (TIGR02574 family)
MLIVILVLSRKLLNSRLLMILKKRWNLMSGKEILEQALKLRSEERFFLIEGLLRSLDKPDREIDEIWVKEAERRLKAYREGRLEGIPMEEVFKD